MAIQTQDFYANGLPTSIQANAGEFIAIAKKKIGTAPSAGVIAYNIMFDYGWE